jgi:hypothetical protein
MTSISPYLSSSLDLLVLISPTQNTTENTTPTTRGILFRLSAKTQLTFTRPAARDELLAQGCSSVHHSLSEEQMAYFLRYEWWAPNGHSIIENSTGASL